MFRVLGALVLWWFAWRFLSAALATPDIGGRAQPSPVLGAAFRDGVVASALNPKTPLFFAAVFGTSGVAQAGIGDRMGFGLLVCLLHFLWFLGVAVLLDRIGARRGSTPFLRAGTGAVAVVLAAAGVLALQG